MYDTLILNSDAKPLTHIPLSVIPWQDAIKLFFLGKINIIAEYDDWVIRSQKLEIKVPSVAIMKEQVNWNKTVRYNRNNVYLRDSFTCQLQLTNRCRSLKGHVKISDLTLDHMIPKSQGGKTTWTNVSTSCHDCNCIKGDDTSIFPLRKPYRPNYYEMLSKRKTFPVQIRDRIWAYYIDWPEDLIIMTTKNKA